MTDLLVLFMPICGTNNNSNATFSDHLRRTLTTHRSNAHHAALHVLHLIRWPVHLHPCHAGLMQMFWLLHVWQGRQRPRAQRR